MVNQTRSGVGLLLLFIIIIILFLVVSKVFQGVKCHISHQASRERPKTSARWYNEDEMLLGIETGGNVDLRAGAASLPLHVHPHLLMVMGSGPGPPWSSLPEEGVERGKSLLVAVSSPPSMKLCDGLCIPGCWVLVVGKGRKESPAWDGVVLVM